MVDFKILSAPFDPDAVSWRLGSVSKAKLKGMALAYVDARVVADRLDEACTPAGWQCRYSHTATKTVCDIAIKCDDEWLWKADGAGDSDIEAEKGALSDAFKRAAVRWGVGRYLYDLESPWVAVEEVGSGTRITHRIVKGEYATLRRVLVDRTRALANMPVDIHGHPHKAAAAELAQLAPASSAHGRQLAAADPHLVDANRAKGALPKDETKPDEGAVKKIEWVKKSIGALRTMNKPAAQAWWKAEAARIEIIETRLPTEYDRLLDAYNLALEKTVELA